MITSSFQRDGYEQVDSFISAQQHEDILSEFALSPSVSRCPKGGIRNAEKHFTSILELCHSPTITEKVAKYLEGSPSLVRTIVFDKTATNNWLVAWHQDKTVAVSGRFSHESWGPWSVKEGVHHVQPPLSVLNNMVTCRIHLDRVNLDNGPLKVIPHSHTLGLLSSDEIAQTVNSSKHINCTGDARSAFIMRPHLLHASSKAITPSQRRILHLEFSSATLPPGIKWAAS